MKMRSPVLFIIFISSTTVIWGRKALSMRMSLEYFHENFVKLICLMSCRLDRGVLDFSKAAFDHLTAVSYVNIDSIDGAKVNACLTQTLTVVGVVVDADCAGYDQAMRYASSNMLLDSSHKWLIIDDNIKSKFNGTEPYQSYIKKSMFPNNKENENIIEVLQEIDTSVDADIVIARKIGNEGFDLHTAFNFGKTKGGKFTVNKLGTWDITAGLQISKRFKYYHRWNFQNTTLGMILVMSVFPRNFSEEMVVGRIPAVGVNSITHIGATVLDVIAKIHSIRYNYTIVDQWIGRYERNATRLVSNSLYFREQDITPVLRFFKYSLDYMDMLHPQVTSIETRYYYRIPSYGPGRIENKFLTPLSKPAWWCIIAIAAACGLVLLLSAILEQHPTSAQYAVFSVIASICQQFFEDVDSMRVQRPSTAGKLTILVTGVFCVLIYNYYTSSVVSWLLNGPPPSITSLRELLESPLKLAYEEIGYTKTWLKVADYNYNKRNAEVELEMRRKKVWSKKRGEPLMVPLNEGIGLIKGGEYAYHMEVNTANRLISVNFDQKELCELGSLQSMERTSLFSAIQKNSPYKEFYVWSIARLKERGFLSCIQKRILSPDVVCAGSSPRALALGGAAPAFILLGFGYVTSLLIMMMERFRVFSRK